MTSNRRIVALITISGLALLIFSLIEREARRALGTQTKVPNLLAGHVPARPTGDNLLKALREISLVTLESAGHRRRLVSHLTRLQHTLLRLLGIPEVAYERLALSLDHFRHVRIMRLAVSIHVGTIVRPTACPQVVARVFVAVTEKAKHFLLAVLFPAGIVMDERDERDLRILRQRA